MALITTYRHDYIDPRQMHLDYNLKSGSVETSNECNCQPENGESADLAAKLNENCGATAENEGKGEWTGIAPMGLLIKARVIPRGDDNDDENIDQCFVEKPNRYLQNLPNSNPTLFENLRTMNKDDLAKTLNTDRLRSTYQVDYGGMAEYNTGTYGDNEMSEDMIRSGLHSTEANDPCTEESLFKDHRAQQKKCLRPVYRAKVCCKHCPAVHGHWQAEKLQTSEYFASVGATGGLIMKEKLNNHSKCNPRNCKHKIMYSMFRDNK